MTPTEHIIHRLQQGLHELNSRKQQVSAGDTRELLVTPFLKHLGYPLENHSRDFTGNHCRPDIIIWTEPVSLHQEKPGRLIIKTEKLGKDFDHVDRPHPTPSEQHLRHVREHPASGPGTIGVLTDGVRYRVCQRGSAPDDIQDLGEWTALAHQGHHPSPEFDLLTLLLRNPAC